MKHEDLKPALALSKRQKKIKGRARGREPKGAKEPKPKPGLNDPTPEQQAKNDFVNAGAAKRKVPVILQMLKDEQITREEFKRLSYYREQASLADTSPVRSNCDFSVKGGGHGPGPAIISASIETGRMEADMGSLYPIVRAVAVDDMTLTQWVARKYPSITPKRLNGAMLDFRFGVGRIAL